MRKTIKIIKDLFVSKKQKEKRRRKLWEVKYLFRSFFEGYDETDEPIIPIRIDTFQITYFTVDFKEKENVVNITLGRPGILIGKGGKTIDTLREFLTKRLKKPTRIHITESKLWSL